jgi:hypothetical protein
MKGLLTFVALGFVGLMQPASGWAACTGTSPAWNTTPDKDSVSSCISSATPGDTIRVGAGSAAWSGTLVISKGISLIGAGAGNTVISGSARPVISYAPSAANAAQNRPFRISGFTFDLLGSGQAIQLSSGNSTTLQTKIRIDHNRFYNSSFVGGGVENLGMEGVIDHNTFDTFRSPLRAWGDMGSGQFWWDTFPVVRYGSADNMYVEDNTFVNMGSVGGSGAYMITDSDTGGRYAYRYNTFTLKEDFWPLFDVHGGRGGLWGAFGGEIYGNLFNNSSYSGYLLSHRGGKMLLFNNGFSGTGSFSINVYDNDGCPPSDHYDDQLINNSYYYNNRKGMTGAPSRAGIGSDNCGYIRENASFWQDAASFNGTSGVGCGTLAKRPATCTTGVAYWATDQSCSDLTGMVGVNPTTPISGVLYQCTKTNTWTAYFTPYPYPHPLIAGTSVPLPTHTVTSSAGPNGGISPSGTRSVVDGALAQFTVTPNAGYTANVGGTCGGTLAGTTYTTKAIIADCTVTAGFSAVPVTHTITASAGPNGGISPSGARTVTDGATAQFTVTPNAGYTANVGGTCGGTLAGTTYTTNAITADCTVTAGFSAVAVTHMVTPSAGPNGSISPNVGLSVTDGETVQFTVTPNAGYTASVGGTCGGALKGTTFTSNAVTADCTVTAVFSAVPGTTRKRPSPPGNLNVR